jgi:Peptidase family S41/N-terminal domain of Peptidase_S41 in eukaryotic IRBP
MNFVSSICTLCLLFVFAPSAWSQVTIPDTPVGRNFSAMLNALNSRDRDVIAKYTAQSGRSESPEEILRTSEQLGRLKLVRIVTSDRLGLEFIVETANGLQILGLLRVEDAEPARVAFSLPWTPVLPGATVVGYGIDAATRSHVIEGVAGKLRQFYVFAEPARRMAEALAQHQRDGDYDAVTNGWVFANRLTEDLQKVSNDKHLVVSFSPVADGPPVRSPYMFDPRLRADCGFERSETLPGEIGYVKINLFVDPSMCRPKAIEVLTSLVGVKGLVFDLRDAVGGHAGMGTFILGQLLDESAQLSAIRSREPAAVQQLHLAEHISGLSFAATPVYVLTSSKTFSTAEWFAYDLQALKRAVIVGETTKGGAHTTRPERIDARFGMNLPYAEAVNPITGRNWEGSGVQPEVPVPAVDALSAALQLARQPISK